MDQNTCSRQRKVTCSWRTVMSNFWKFSLTIFHVFNQIRFEKIAKTDLHTCFRLVLTGFAVKKFTTQKKNFIWLSKCFDGGVSLENIFRVVFLSKKIFSHKSSESYRIYESNCFSLCCIFMVQKFAEFPEKNEEKRYILVSICLGKFVLPWKFNKFGAALVLHTRVQCLLFLWFWSRSMFQNFDFTYITKKLVG